MGAASQSSELRQEISRASSWIGDLLRSSGFPSECIAKSYVQAVTEISVATTTHGGSYLRDDCGTVQRSPSAEQRRTYLRSNWAIRFQSQKVKGGVR